MKTKKTILTGIILSISLMSLLIGLHPAIWLCSIPVGLFVHA